jgi:aspartate racemase
MTGTNPLVGVLGGMGPAATADFYAKLIRHTPAATDQEHLRVAIWADPTVPDRVAAVLDGSTDPYPVLLEGATKLRSLGASLVAMPCHTAHFFLPRLAAETGLAFLDMLAETIVEITRRELSRVGLLGTAGTLRSELYQRRLAAAGVRFVLPDETIQHEVDEAIRCVKSGTASAGRPFLAHALRFMHTAGAEAVVLACTELPLALGDSPTEHGPPVLDPTDVLARAVVRECHPAGDA